MSHFVVVVVGEDVCVQLEPYSEQDYDDKYAAFEDCTEEIEEGWKQYPLDLLAGGGALEEYKTEEEYAEQYHGYIKNDEGRYGYRHNPNAQWDWWEVGGRWDGFFLDNSGETVNEVVIKDLNTKEAQDNAEKRARGDFAVWETIFTREGKALSWATMRGKHKVSIDVARKRYHAQPAIKTFTTLDHWNCPVELYGYDEEDYVARCLANVFVPFAVVMGGKWVSKGQMGWFGQSKDKVSDEEWDKNFHDLLNNLPPDTLLTAVDCHI